jgi:hypothetical protein
MAEKRGQNYFSARETDCRCATGPDPSPENSSDPFFMLAVDDNVAVATRTIEAGEIVAIDGQPVRIRETIPTGHKVAIRPIAAGEKITKYGAPIGSATRDIMPGQYVHTHNVKSDYLPTLERGAAGWGLGARDSGLGTGD